MKPEPISRADDGRAASASGLFGLVAATAVVAVLAATVMLATASDSRPPPTASAAQAALDPARFMLNALIVPALDSDAVPLRWVDPRSASLCGPATTVHLNRKPLVAGSVVPATSFELEWHADGCRPFGVSGPRLDGRVRLTVFREDGALSAIVEPAGLRIRHAGRDTTWTRRSAGWLPIDDGPGAPAQPIELTPSGAGG
ncbi:MAG: hypothetical protein V4792_10595 [Pseudomonadota bacterium]